MQRITFPPFPSSSINDKLKKAADDLAKNGPADGRQEKLNDALADAADLINASASLLPALPDMEGVQALKAQVESPPVRQNNDPIAERNNTKQLDDWGKSKGVTPTDQDTSLAACIDRAEKSLAGLSRAVNGANPEKPRVDSAKDKVPPALDDLAKAVGDVLKDVPQKIADANEKSKAGLEERKKELDKLAKEVEALQNKIDQSPGAPKPEDVKELDKKKTAFQDIAARALDDVNPDKSIHLHADPKGDEHRKFLNDQIKDSQSTPLPTDGSKAPEETKKLADQIEKTKAKLDEFGKGLDDTAQKAQDQAKALADSLPKALQ